MRDDPRMFDRLDALKAIGRTPGHRRLRHRLRLALLSEAPAGGLSQDRPLARQGRGLRDGGHRHHPGGGQPRAQPRHHGHRGRHRDAGPARPAPHGRLRPGPGLLLRAAGLGETAFPSSWRASPPTSGTGVPHGSADPARARPHPRGAAHRDRGLHRRARDRPVVAPRDGGLRAGVDRDRRGRPAGGGPERAARAARGPERAQPQALGRGERALRPGAARRRQHQGLGPAGHGGVGGAVRADRPALRRPRAARRHQRPGRGPVLLGGPARTRRPRTSSRPTWPTSSCPSTARAPRAWSAWSSSPRRRCAWTRPTSAGACSPGTSRSARAGSSA